MIIDGKNAILGRLATHVAKELMDGKDVTIVNSEKIIITGSPKEIMIKYRARRKRGTPQHGPFFPKKPDGIVRRTIRGMIPKTKKGRAAFRKLRVYIEIPEELKKSEITNIEVKAPKSDFITLGELARSIGWTT